MAQSPQQCSHLGSTIAQGRLAAVSACRESSLCWDSQMEAMVSRRKPGTREAQLPIQSSWGRDNHTPSKIWGRFFQGKPKHSNKILKSLNQKGGRIQSQFLMIKSVIMKTETLEIKQSLHH